MKYHVSVYTSPWQCFCFISEYQWIRHILLNIIKTATMNNLAVININLYQTKQCENCLVDQTINKAGSRVICISFQD